MEPLRMKRYALAKVFLRTQPMIPRRNLSFPTHVCLLALAALLLPTPGRGADAALPRLSFDNLVIFSQQKNLDPSLQAKLDAILATPVVKNRPALPATSGAPTSLRVTEWNIERGENLDAIQQMLQSPNAFLEQAQRGKKKLSPAALAKLRAQVKTVRQSDVLILNEVDIGVKRTDYRNVVDEMARSLGMSSVYAVEFLEVDSLVDLGTEAAVLNTPELSARMTEDLKPDRDRYQGLHVNAILSRYPLQNARVIQLPVCYDWFNGEHRGISQLEQGKRKAADVLFLERMAREVRRGNRSALVADIAVPGAGTAPVRIVNAHLENKCKADCRNRQMKRVLEEIGDTTGPLVLAGDLNTTGTDGTPTSIRYELTSRLKDYQFWISTFLRFTPVGIPVYATAPFSFWKNFRDPTAAHIPVIGRNPEARMFSTVRNFRFADGGSVDFRGVASRNLQKSGKTLSDSNERARKGFVPTFSMNRDFGGVIKYRLDWIFVKPERATDVRRSSHSFQPQMPLTMNELNNAIPERLSDHAPISVEIPLSATKTAAIP